MAKSYFEYRVPSVWELREEYIVPYRFSEELRAYVKYMFEHPQHSKHRTLFTRQFKETDLNDMLKYPYLIIRHYQAHPQQYGHRMENIVPHILAGMWKAFLNLHKQLRGLKLDKYLPMSMKLLVLAENGFLDIFLSDIERGNMIMQYEEMRKPAKKSYGHYSEKRIREFESFE